MKKKFEGLFRRSDKAWMESVKAKTQFRISVRDLILLGEFMFEKFEKNCSTCDDSCERFLTDRTYKVWKCFASVYVALDSFYCLILRPYN